MSFPLSSERGLVVPSPPDPQTAAATLGPTSSNPSNQPGSETSFLPSLEFDRGVLETEIRKCNTEILYLKVEVPKKEALNRYLCAYFEGMHEHHPFIHTATFDPATIKGATVLLRISLIVAPLFLSMACIGALFCHERDTSKKLHVAARKLINHVLFFWRRE